MSPRLVCAVSGSPLVAVLSKFKSELLCAGITAGWWSASYPRIYDRYGSDNDSVGSGQARVKLQ